MSENLNDLTLDSMPIAAVNPELNALARFDADVLIQAGVPHGVILEGRKHFRGDFGSPGPWPYEKRSRTPR